MNRTISLAAALAAAFALPAIAEDAKSKVEPGKAPTSTMTDSVPSMKRDAAAIDQAGAEKLLPAAKAMEDAMPSMRPGDPPSGRADSGSSTNTPAGDTGAKLSLTELEGKTWVDKPVYTSDGFNIGEVVDFQRDAANNVVGMHADIGGLLGFGQTRVNITTLQFKLNGDRVVLGMTAEQAKSLPKTSI